MGLFFDFHPDRYPPGSFQTPVQPPTSDPAAEPLIQVCFNASWLPYILGAFAQLTMNTTWSGTDDEIQAARNAANNLIVLFQTAKQQCFTNPVGSAGASEDYMLRQNPDNPCELQSSVDGLTWCTWADISKCISPQQPGAGAAQPPAGMCQEFNGVISPLINWLLPVPVSTGDTVEFSNLNGSWSPIAALDVWYCPDGNVYFAGGCADGTSTTDSRDPMPTAPLFGVVAFDGTNYYDISAAAGSAPVTITIAAGISKRNLVIKCNTYTAIDPGGEVNFIAKVCNNQAATWTATLDFSASPDGFVRVTGGGYGPRGTWVPAVGWTQSLGTDSGAVTHQGMVIQRTAIPAFNITSLIVTVDLVKGDDPFPGDYGLHVYTSDGSTPHDFVNLTLGAMVNGNNQRFGGPGSFNAQTLIFVEFSCGNDSAPTDPGGTCSLLSMTITGTGTNPFTGP